MFAIRDLRKAVAAAALAVLGATAPGHAEEPSGTAVDVVPLARADGSAGFRVLVDQGSVYSGDKIVTGPIGQAQILFRDNTKLVVGPNSSMTIDAFVYSGKNGAQNVSIDAVKGAFRFITGISKKDAYSISTPTAVIAVRGTEFDMHVDRGGETEVVMLGGATTICPKTLPNGEPNTKHTGCVLANALCAMTIIPPGGDSLTQLKASQRRNSLLNRDFRYIRNQDGLNPEFQVSLSHCGSAASIQNVPTTAPAGSGGNAPPPPPPGGGGGNY